MVDTCPVYYVLCRTMMTSLFLGREKLADADPAVEDLARRLRSWDAAMTQVKVDGLLAELPTKRLLMQYAQGFVDRADPPGNFQVQCVGSRLNQRFTVAAHRPYRRRVLCPQLVNDGLISGAGFHEVSRQHSDGMFESNVLSTANRYRFDDSLQS